MARRKKNGAEIFIGDWVEVNNRNPNPRDPRRFMEKLQGGAIKEDPNAMANLPTQGYQANFPYDPHKHAMMHTDIELED